MKKSLVVGTWEMLWWYFDQREISILLREKSGKFYDKDDRDNKGERWEN